MTLAKRTSNPFRRFVSPNTSIVPSSVLRVGTPVIQRHYAAIPAVTSPAQPPAVQRPSEPRKGVMDYVLTTADSVCRRDSGLII